MKKVYAVFEAPSFNEETGESYGFFENTLEEAIASAQRRVDRDKEDYVIMEVTHHIPYPQPEFPIHTVK